MNMLSVKLLRDLKAARSRLALMAVAVAVSLTVFGGVLYAWAVVGRETADAYAGTDPASATIVLDEAVAPEELAAIAADARSRPGVLDAAARTQFTSAVTVAGIPVASPLMVFAAVAEDPMTMARFDVEGASWPPAADEIYLGDATLDLLGAEVGDRIGLQTPDGSAVELRVAATVYDPSLAPAAQEQTGRGYVSTAALGAAGMDQLKIQVAGQDGEPSRDRAAVVAAATDLADALRAEYGLAVGEVQVPEPYAHPHQGQTDAMLLALLGAGAAALLLSAILVATMLNGLFNRQIPQIGITKAVGARTGTVTGFYAAMTAVVAAAATAAALVPAVLLGRSGSAMILEFLGIAPASLAAPWWVWAVLAGAGLGLPPLLALVPVLRAGRTTVRRAIDHHGLDAGADRSGWTAWFSRLRFLDRGLLLALRNTMRRPARSVLAAVVLASAGAVFVAGLSLGEGTDAIDQERIEERNWDVEVALGEPVSVDEAAAVLEGVEGVTAVEGWSMQAGGVAEAGETPVTRTYPDQGHGRVTVVAVPPDSATVPEPELLEGRWLEEGETGVVVLNQVARDTAVEGAAVGDTVSLYVEGVPSEWTVVGIVEEHMNGGGAYVSAEGLAAAGGEAMRANQWRLTTVGHDEASRQEAAEAAEAALEAAGFTVLSADSVSRTDAIIGGHLGPIIAVLLAVAVVMGVIGGIGLASTMGANVLDRTRELGVMHAIGARPREVRRVVVAEGVFLALSSCVLAIVPALALIAVLGAGIGELFMAAPLPFRISWIGVAAWTVLVVLGAILASEAAAARASRITVREALAYQ
ncbi:ABC transporter permease [Glycomyces arizonensis]|uniref:ABC transporter permease n=1 Tax=Glycomyces arizonensis TaxID=256035 RepID=UPI0004209288|nr:ABC transporter permease [Glycomyces arizonensis]